MKQTDCTGKMPVKNMLCLLLATFLWGVAFVAQSIGGEEIDAFAYTGIRFLMGAVVLAPFIAVRRKRRSRIPDEKPGGADAGAGRRAITGGILCGIFLAAAALLQQIGIEHVDVGKAGFLTALYIILVPCLSFLLTRRSSAKVWIAAAVALCGLYCLCMEPGEAFSIGAWEGCLILCALMFAVQILLIDHFSPGVDPLEMSFVEFLTTGAIGTAAAAVQGNLTLEGISTGALLALLYSGILSSGVAYTLQVVGQRGADPSIASLIMSLEAPISAAAGFVILQQALSAWELLGCVLMSAAIVLAQLPVPDELGTG